MYRRSGWYRILGILTLLALAAGCGPRRVPRTEATQAKPKPPPRPTATTLQHSTVNVSDPQGRWTFETVAKTVTSTSEAGPYQMAQAQGVYRKLKPAGQDPVYMTARRIDLDQRQSLVVLRGEVHVTSGGITIQGEQVYYNLKTGKVSAPSRTKLTFVPGKASRPSAPTAPGSGATR